MIPTRIPQQKQLISKPQKQNPQSSPMTRSTVSIHLESMMNPDLDENEEESTTSFPINIFDGQYHEVNPGQYNETNPGQYHEENPGQYHETNPGQYGNVTRANTWRSTQASTRQWWSTTLRRRQKATMFIGKPGTTS